MFKKFQNITIGSGNPEVLLAKQINKGDEQTLPVVTRSHLPLDFLLVYYFQ